MKVTNVRTGTSARSHFNIFDIIVRLIKLQIVNRRQTMFTETRTIECSEARSLVEAGAQLDDQKPVIVYCASGMRSRQATSALRASGFRDVHDLGAWKNLVNCN